MGMCAIVNEGQDKDLNLIKEQDLDKLQDIASLPFQVDFQIPIVKITTGDSFAGMLSAEGQVFTWGYNNCGALGIDDELVILQLKPDPSKPLKFKDNDKSYNIIDIASGYTSMIALTDQREIFVWGHRMGIYTQPELTLRALEQNGKVYNSAEIHQVCPRLIKNNLIFHKVNKIVSGHFNTALITDKGELLLQGMNEFGQLALPLEISGCLQFFPEFVKVDFLHDYFVKEVSLGSCVVHAICEHKVTGRIKLFGWGSNQNGQLGLSDLTVVKREPFDMTSIFIEQKSIGEEEDVIFDEDEIVQVSSGGFHSLFMIKKAPD